MKTVYEVGDEVQILTLEEIQEISSGSRYDIKIGSVFFVEKMIRGCGKFAKITDINPYNDCYDRFGDDVLLYRLQFIKGKYRNDYTYTSEMFAPHLKPQLPKQANQFDEELL